MLSVSTTSTGHRHYSLFNKKLISLVSALIFSLILAGSLSYQWLLSIHVEKYIETQQELLTHARDRLRNEMGEMRYMLRVLITDPALRESLKAEQAMNGQRLARLFTRFMSLSSHAVQMRWIDKTGLEQVRVQRDGEEIIVLPESQLQNKAHKDYFSSAMQLSAGQMYLSDINLNTEHGELVRPYEKTLRAIFRTGIRGQLKEGMLVINYRVNELLQQLGSAGDTRIEVVKDNGEWILHPDAKREFARILGLNSMTFQQRSPDLWQTMSEEETGFGLLADGRINSFIRIPFSSEFVKKVDAVFLVSTTAAEKLATLRQNTLSIVSGSGLILFMLISFLMIRTRSAHAHRDALLDELAQERQELSKTNQELLKTLDEHQKMQNAMVEMKKLSSMGMMVSDVAHELNTPLGGAAVVISNLDSARRELAASVESGLTRKALDDYLEHTEEGLQLAKMNLSHARKVVNSFRRLAVSRHSDDRELFDFMSLARDIEFTTQHRLRKTHLDIVVSGPQSLDLYGYPGVMSQMLQTLADNAIEHAYSDEQQGTIRIDISLQNEQLLITVSDDGEGIDPNIRTKMFEPFETSARDKAHTGLGLHLCHQWVTELMQGSIEVKSEPGVGTRFIIRLPARYDEERKCHSLGV